jgi:hypothetical protein
VKEIHSEHKHIWWAISVIAALIGVVGSLIAVILALV